VEVIDCAAGTWLRAYRRGQRPSGQGFFSAPWWRLLLWMVIFVVVLLLAGELGIV
jgi:hypothetical protein